MNLQSASQVGSADQAVVAATTTNTTSLTAVLAMRAPW